MKGNIFPKLDFLNIKIFEGNISVCTKKNWNGVSHNNDYSRFYIVTKGEGHIMINNQNLPVLPGYIYLIPSLTKISLHAHNDMEIIWVHFDLEFFSGMSVFNIFKPSFAISNSEQDEEIFSNLIHNLQNPSPQTLLQQYAVFLNLISRFMPHDTNMILPKQESLISFEKVINHIQNNPKEQFSLEKLAKIANLQHEYFSRTFKRCFGISPSHFHLQCRMKLAKKLLFTTNKTLKEISELCGYKDQFHFARTFAEFFGSSPGVARKNSKHKL